MVQPTKTYELRVEFAVADPSDRLALKERVKDWLVGRGFDTFVEGAIDGLDMDHEYGLEPEFSFEDLGGEALPLSIYKFEKSLLEDLQRQLNNSFAADLRTELLAIDTEAWTEGWKESFRPITTDKFYVYPPWDAVPGPADLIKIVIEPAMAFGTGQHATTQLCLRALGDFSVVGASKLAQLTMLDVGTGTGILAIAARKLGFKDVFGTDIDPDAVRAAVDNAAANKTDFEATVGSIPDGLCCDVVVANILHVVLLKLLPELKDALKPSGRLILSGLLATDIPEMREHAEALGLSFVRQDTLQDWACLQFGRPQ